MRLDLHDSLLHGSYIGAMDKKITRETPIDDHIPALENLAMENEMLFDEALDLAYATFSDATTEDHIECIYVRLKLNADWGLGDDGATTVH